MWHVYCTVGIPLSAGSLEQRTDLVIRLEEEN